MENLDNQPEIDQSREQIQPYSDLVKKVEDNLKALENGWFYAADKPEGWLEEAKKQLVDQLRNLADKIEKGEDIAIN